MGGRVSIQHAETGLFLDCKGSNNHGTPVTHSYNNTRDQWFILNLDNGLARIRTDHHNRKICVMDNCTIRLSRRNPATVFELISVEGPGEGFTQFKCSYGYLAGPATAGPVEIIPSGRGRSSLWKMFPKSETARQMKSVNVSCPLSPAVPPIGPPYGPFPVDNKELEPTNWQQDTNESESGDEVEPWTVTGALFGIVDWLSQPYDASQRPASVPGAIISPRHKHHQKSASFPAAASSSSAAAAPAPPPSADRILLVRTTVLSDLTPGVENTTLHFPGQVEEFELQEGVTNVETLHFKVLAGPLVNLKRRMTTFKMSFQVDKREVAMGTFDGTETEHSFTFPTNPVPSGWHVRGQYRSVVEFLDDAGLCCKPTEKHFSIVKRKG